MRDEAKIRRIAVLPLLLVALLASCGGGGGGASSPPDTAPSFAGKTVADQQFIAGDAIAALALPAATGGNGPIAYALAPDIPGLAFASASRRLSGTPTAAGTYAMTYTATDSDRTAPDTATLRFEVLVEPPPTMLRRLDSVPAADVAIDSTFAGAALAHVAPTGLDWEYRGGCSANIAIRHALPNRADDVEVVHHKLGCELAPQRAYDVVVDGRQGSGERHRATLPFVTGNAGGRTLTVEETRTVPKAHINEMFNVYTRGLLDDLPRLVEILAAPIVKLFVREEWPALAKPSALYDVAVRRVSYSSTTPAGERSDALTGLVAFPDEAAGAEPRERLIVLQHATGGTPGSLDEGDGWFLFATMLAARGYLVVAADNYGRGGTSDAPETYLLAHRTANNTIDLIHAVLESDEFGAHHEAAPELAVIGYSQGGHSAIGTWLDLAAAGESALRVREVYSGGAPHNLHGLYRGLLLRLGGDCGEDPYCGIVETDALLPYLFGRLLPGILAYVDTGLVPSELISGGKVSPAFVAGALAGDPRYDDLDAAIALNSFANITNLADLPDSAADTRIHLYHSPYDRLVPRRNTDELANLLERDFAVDFHRESCNSRGYRTLAQLSPRAGLVHSMCGLTMLNDAMRAFR